MPLRDNPIYQPLRTRQHDSHALPRHSARDTTSLHVILPDPQSVSEVTNDETTVTSGHGLRAPDVYSSLSAEPKITQYNESMPASGDVQTFSQLGCWATDPIAAGKSRSSLPLAETKLETEIVDRAARSAYEPYAGPLSWRFDFRSDADTISEIAKATSLEPLQREVDSKIGNGRNWQNAGAFRAKSLTHGADIPSGLQALSLKPSSQETLKRLHQSDPPVTRLGVGKKASRNTGSEKLLSVHPPALAKDAEFLEDFSFRLWCALTGHTRYRSHAPSSPDKQGSPKSSTSQPYQDSTHDRDGKRKRPDWSDRTNKDDEEKGDGPPQKYVRKAAEPDEPLYACLVCMGNPKLGYDTPCTDFETDNIEEVLRHLKRIHLELKHVTEESVADVKRLWLNTRKADRGPQLWKQAFRILYPAAPQVPSPCKCIRPPVTEGFFANGIRSTILRRDSKEPSIPEFRY